LPKPEAPGFFVIAGAALLLAGCSDPSPPPETKPASRAEQPTPAATPAPAPTAPPAVEPPAADVGSPAALLRRYHDLIAARRFADAYRLREPGGADLAAFTAHFARFRTHQATIGTPSQPAAAGEWIYVEVPVQSYGIMADGKPFGSAGTVTLRRPRRGGEWRIYTKR